MARPLGIVVVNYASSALLRANLVPSAAAAGAAHVVVVDNRTTDEERRAVRALADEHGWHLVEPDANLGFGEGMNRGVARARELGAQDLLLLNPDASVGVEAVRLLQAAVAEDRRTVVSPRVVDGAGTTWFAGADVYLSDGLTRSVSKRAARPDERRWEWLSGACLLVPDEAWDFAGGFDDDYFLYWEDVDFSRRIVKGGGSIRVVLEAIATHDEGGTHAVRDSARAKSPVYYYYAIRNRVLFAAKQTDPETLRRWASWPSMLGSAREILLRGGRRQFARPVAPLRAAYRGIRDARRIARDHVRSRTPSAEE